MWSYKKNWVLSDLPWYSVFAAMLKQQSLSFFYVWIVRFGSLCVFGVYCFVYFAWVFVFSFMLFCAFCAFWVFIFFVLLCFFCVSIESKSRVGTTKWLTTHANRRGAAAAVGTFPLFLFFFPLFWGRFFYFFLSSSRRFIFQFKLKSSVSATKWLTIYLNCIVHRITIQYLVNTIHSHCWLIMIFAFEIIRFPPQNDFNHALVPHHCCESDLRSR